MLKVKRVTLVGVPKAIEFDTVCGKWLVKNFTSGDIFVSFEAETPQAECIKILAGDYQIVTTNEYYDWNDDYKSKKIYVNGTGEVEVQQLCYH